MKKYCPKCNKIVKTKHGRKKKTEMFLFGLGFITFGIGWVILVFYRLFTPKAYCHICNKGIN